MFINSSSYENGKLGKDDLCRINLKKKNRYVKEERGKEISLHKSRDLVKALPEHPEASLIVNIFV